MFRVLAQRLGCCRWSYRYILTLISVNYCILLDFWTSESIFTFDLSLTSQSIIMMFSVGGCKSISKTWKVSTSWTIFGSLLPAYVLVPDSPKAVTARSRVSYRPGSIVNNSTSHLCARKPPCFQTHSRHSPEEPSYRFEDEDLRHKLHLSRMLDRYTPISIY
jgi:hypothetical protein